MLSYKVQIMIAQHDDGALAQRPHEAKDLERLRAAIDQIADEPEPVGFAKS